MTLTSTDDFGFVKTDNERIHRLAVRTILGRTYTSYDHALESLILEHLEVRRIRLCLQFALKAESHPKFSHWFKIRHRTYNTRGAGNKYEQIYARHERYVRSPLGYLTTLLNKHYNKI